MYGLYALYEMVPYLLVVRGKKDGVLTLLIRSGQVRVFNVHIQSTPLTEQRKEMFYLTTHSTHFIYGKGNPLPPHGLLFPINSKGSFICTIPQTGYPIPRPFNTNHGALAGTRNSSMGPPHEGSIRRLVAP